MENVSTANPNTPVEYSFPPSEIIEKLVSRISSPAALSIIRDLPINWIPRKSDYLKLKTIAKNYKDAIRTLGYIPSDSRTPDRFMEPNGQVRIVFSKTMDIIHAYDYHFPVEGLAELSRVYMLPGIEVSECQNCNRVLIADTIVRESVSSRTLADIYNMKLKEQVLLCPFEFISLCVEIEYLHPESLEVKPIPTLPDGRPIIWIGDPGWSKHSEEYRQKSLQYQRNF